MGSGLTLDRLQEIADLEFTSIEFDSEFSVRQWLRELLCRVWIEKDNFSGKKAFGNSDWEYDLYIALAENNIINGSVNEDNDWEIEQDQIEKADKIILDIIVEVM